MFFDETRERIFEKAVDNSNKAICWIVLSSSFY